MNRLQCPLCSLPYHQPKMCPHCSQVFCHSCISSYLNRYYFCPSCDQHVIELVDCSRLINEVKEKIKQSDLKKSQKLIVQNTLLCKQHNLALKYHCITCSINICSDCGLISQQHISHNIKPLENPPKNTITRSQLKQIKRKVSNKLNFYQQQKKGYILELELLKSQIKYNKTKIFEYYEELILRLEKQTQILLKDIESKINQCNKNIEEKVNFKQKLQDLQKVSALIQKSHQIHIEGGPVQQVHEIEILDKEFYKYLQDKNYLNKYQKARNSTFFKKQQNQNGSDKSQKPEENSQKSLQLSRNSLLLDKKIYELNVMKQIYPQYHNFSFQVDYFLSQSQDLIYSPNFKVYGYEWRLKIYPKGNVQVLGNYLSVFLELVKSPQAIGQSEQKQYNFRLQLLNLNQAGKTVIKEYKSTFNVGQCWGYAQFIQLQDLRDFLHEGKLLFVMGVKNVNYFDQCDNMQKYIFKLQGENKMLSEICQNYYLHSDHQSNQISNNIQSEINSSDSSDHDNLILNLPLQNLNLLTEDQISSIISSLDFD